LSFAPFSLLDDLKERRGYSHLKEEALDRTMWRAPVDGREDARNMLSCTQTSNNKLEKLLHLVCWFIWIARPFLLHSEDTLCETPKCLNVVQQGHSALHYKLISYW